MGGIVVYEQEMNDEDIQVKYIFNHGEQADYIGMAKTYQDYLIDQGVLSQKQGTSPDIPLRIDFLGAESQNGLFFKKMIPMTTTGEMQEILNDLQNDGIADIMVVFKGWNKGGVSGMNPVPVSFENKLGDQKEWNELIVSLKNKNIPLYFYDNYAIGYGKSKRFSVRKDAAIKIDKTILEKKTYKDVYESFYYLSGQKTTDVIKANINQYKKQDISLVAVDGMSNILYSEMKKDTVLTRGYNASRYIDNANHLYENLDSVVMYEPNDYMLQYADAYLDIPMSTSQYTYLDDTVPFIQIVLKGYMDYYAPYSNFSANQQEELLRLRSMEHIHPII